MKKLVSLFGTLSSPEMPQGLVDSVLYRVQAERVRAARMRLVFWSPLSLASFVAAFPLFRALATELGTTGFVQYLNLLFTDSTVVLAHSQSFALTLLESLPVVATAFFLAAVFVCIASVAVMARSLKDAIVVPRLSIY